jgi:nucleotide-binding universal stress UspA family protein
MSYSTLMVHLELGRGNAALLNLAGDLAQRFDAGVIGIAIGQPAPLSFGDGYVDGAAIEEGRHEREREIQEAEAEFRAVLGTRLAHLEWRSRVLFSPLADYLAREARSADLLITRAGAVDLFDASRSANAGELLMLAGRPLLLVPGAVTAAPVRCTMVAWKDTREARRAIVDALPLLRQSPVVAVVEIAAGQDLAAARGRLRDVTAWLKRHGVGAESQAVEHDGDDGAMLAATADRHGADLLVAGAYGHSRLREWAMGGITRDLLACADRCVLLSH